MVWGALCLGGCAREQEAFLCPDVGEGELIVTEIRGNADDVGGQWIELFNLTDRDLDLFGLRVTMRPLDGDAPDVILVRREMVEMAAGSYAVLGRFNDSNLPEHADYGFSRDLEMDLLESAIIEVKACGVVTDRVVYRGLPETGTLYFDGSLPPDAEVNDDEMLWCRPGVGGSDGGSDTGGSDTGAIPIDVDGTPGEANPPCG